MGGSEQVYFAYLTEPHEAGHSAETAPQHLTFFHPFRAEYQQIALESITIVTKYFQQFPIEIGEAALYGPNKDIPVRLIRPKGILNAIHWALLGELESRSATLDDRRYIGRNYSPHITIKAGQPVLEAGQQLTVDNVALLHKSPDMVTIIAKHPLDET